MSSNPIQGHMTAFRDPDPWPDPVDGAALLDTISATFSRHLALPEGAADAMALWTIHCHAFDAFSIAPLLVFTSPDKRCGKTNALIVLSALVPRRLLTSNISPAALFRIVEIHHPTLLIDEAETFIGAKDELRGILDSGHTRDTAYVIRCQGKDFDPRQFSTWSPKAIALIGRLHPTLEDRSIVVAMRRRMNEDQIVKYRRDRIAAALESLQRQAWRWAKDHLEVLRGHDPNVPADFNDRAADNWRPLLAIADFAGGSWPERGRKAAMLLSATEEGADMGTGTQLLADIRGLFAERRTDRLSSQEIVTALGGMEDRPWPEFSAGRPLTKTQMAKILQPFRVKPKLIRIGENTPKGYLLADFSDAFVRYLPVQPQQAPQPQRPQGEGETPTQADFVVEPMASTAGSETPREPRDVADVAGVAAFRETVKDDSAGLPASGEVVPGKTLE